MNEADLSLPGLEPATAVPPRAKAPVLLSPPRVKPVDRRQLVWRSVDVERLVEEDHPVRAIWQLTGQLDLQSFYRPIEAVEGAAGRTPWDPRLLVSLWTYAYSRGISSAREIARRCTYEPAFQWLCGMEPINHHTLSDFRVAQGTGLQELFVSVLGVLSSQGLVSLERVMHDGTKIKANASRDSFQRAESLQEHLVSARQQVEQLAEQTDEESQRQAAAQERAVRERQQRVEQALAQLEQIQQSKHGPKEKAAARASLSDPQARIMKQPDGGYAPSYNVQISTEATNKIIVGVGVSQNGNDYAELAGGVQRVEQNLKAKPQQVVADGGFTSRENIVGMAERGIDFIGSLPDPQAAASTALERHGVSAAFSAQAFTYDVVQDEYQCPAGQELRRVGQDERRAGVIHHNYQADKSVCPACPFKAQCCPQSGRGRSLTRSVEAVEVQQFRQKMQTPQARDIYRQRAPVAEFPHAWLKAKLGLRQFRLRGLPKVGLEVLWACLTYNVQQWIRLCWRPSLAAANN